MEIHNQLYVTVFRSRHKRQRSERALVLSAAGIEYATMQDGGEFALLVHERDAERARFEIEEYDRESLRRSRAPRGFGHPAGDGLGVFVYVVVMLIVDTLKNQRVLGVDWFAIGQTDSALIQQGQWWRTVTALCLHIDAAHLIGNVIVGGLFGFLASQMVGAGLAWFAILLAGAAGNAINALIREAPHTSVGASTAVFGALGIVSGFAWRHRQRTPGNLMLRWSPLVSGAVLLGFFGAGGERTDVAAHLFGFVAGLALGACFGGAKNRVPASTRGQGLFAAATGALIVLAWTLAITIGTAD